MDLNCTALRMMAVPVRVSLPVRLRRCLWPGPAEQAQSDSCQVRCWQQPSHAAHDRWQHCSRHRVTRRVENAAGVPTACAAGRNHLYVGHGGWELHGQCTSGICRRKRRTSRHWPKRVVPEQRLQHLKRTNDVRAQPEERPDRPVVVGVVVSVEVVRAQERAGLAQERPTVIPTFTKDCCAFPAHRVQCATSKNNSSSSSKPE